MTGYYRAKRELEREEAKRYLDAREREQAISRRKAINERDVNWIAEYRASGRARTGFDWRPRWPLKPPEEDNGKEIEGNTVMANADAAGQSDAQPGAEEATPSAGISDPQGDAQDFTDQDRTPF